MLRDELARANALLRARGVDATGDADADLLMEVMELREGLASAKASKDRAALEQLGATVEKLTSGARHTLATSLDENDQPTEAARALVRLRYYRRFLDEHQLALDELP